MVSSEIYDALKVRQSVLGSSEDLNCKLKSPQDLAVLWAFVRPKFLTLGRANRYSPQE
jgi:hypothetical protein